MTRLGSRVKLAWVYIWRFCILIPVMLPLGGGAALASDRTGGLVPDRLQGLHVVEPVCHLHGQGPGTGRSDSRQ